MRESLKERIRNHSFYMDGANLHILVCSVLDLSGCVRSYEAWILHFRESTGIGIRYFYCIFWVRTDNILILFFIFLQRVHMWYARGSQIQKNTNFFSFSFIRFFIYRKI
jgi:hypothetical protein